MIDRVLKVLHRRCLYALGSDQTVAGMLKHEA